MIIVCIGAAWGGEKAVEYGLCDGTYTVMVDTIAMLIKAAGPIQTTADMIPALYSSIVKY